MSNKSIKLIASIAVALGTLGVSVQSNADSLLSPLVLNTKNYDTVLSYKMYGTGGHGVNAGNGWASPSEVHYWWGRKLATGGGYVRNLTGLRDPVNYPAGCLVSNNTGRTSPADVMLHNAEGRIVADDTGDNLVTGGNASDLVADLSTGKGYLNGQNFVGYVVIDDSANLSATSTLGEANEGEISGFTYIINKNNGEVFSTKLINNHRSKQSGDFNNSYIAKQSIDFMWLPASPNKNKWVESTSWFTIAIGSGMSDDVETGTIDGVYRGTVNFSYNALPAAINANGAIQTSADPKGPTNGIRAAYDNDEVFRSGTNNLTVTCMAMFDRTQFLDLGQVAATHDGGWQRRSILGSGGATGALTYRIDNLNNVLGVTRAPISYDINANGRMNKVMTVETSGHLRNGALGNHPNRPF